MGSAICRPFAILGLQWNSQTMHYIGCAVSFTDHALYCVGSVVHRPCAILGGQFNSDHTPLGVQRCSQTMRYIECAVEFTNHALHCVGSVVHRQGRTWEMGRGGFLNRSGPRGRVSPCFVAGYVFDINQLSLPIPFYSVLVPVSVFIALSTVFHSIYSPDNSSLFHSILRSYFALLVL